MSTRADLSTASRADGRTALTNVRVFDGRRLLEAGTVVIDGELIGTDAVDARVIDCGGAALLPGLIDAHVHLSGRQSLQRLADHGVTTALDMSTWPATLVESLRGVKGLTDIRSPGASAVSPGSFHGRIVGFPAEALVAGPEDAERYVTDRLAERADYIKITLEEPGFDQPTVDALAASARRHGKLSVAHTASSAAIVMALESQVDVLAHVPLDRVLDEAVVARFLADGRISVPTLTMMQCTAENFDRVR